jgi:hypothetical protein
VTEKNVIGYYRLKNGDITTIKINPNHTFEYTSLAIDFFAKKTPLDSAYFTTKGTWRFSAKDKLVFNSDSKLLSDTSRVRKINKKLINLKESNFTFLNIPGDTIHFNYVYDGQRNLIRAIADADFTNIDIETSKYDTLIFQFQFYQSYIFIKKDNLSANYTITLAPYFKEDYFKNKEFKLKRNRIIDTNKTLIFKRSKLLWYL